MIDGTHLHYAGSDAALGQQTLYRVSVVRDGAVVAQSPECDLSSWSLAEGEVEEFLGQPLPAYVGRRCPDCRASGVEIRRN